MRWSWDQLLRLPPEVYPVLIDLINEWNASPSASDLEDM